MPSAKVKGRSGPIAFTLSMECLLVKKLPEGPEWVYELKLDGYRAQVIRETDGVRLLSRNAKILASAFPTSSPLSLTRSCRTP